ncbi:MAG: hypothetical protein UZ22_OP11002000112 [Microgenomates bacterium OLB23]|nr:MAG: hypothetical protein UZ22_OP11002000112 [Microgenomates bacterium OLB23]
MYPFQIRSYIQRAFERIYNPKIMYRATGCTIFDLEKADTFQETLFSQYHSNEERLKKFYPLIDQKKVTFGTSLFSKEKFSKTMFQYQTITS